MNICGGMRFEFCHWESILEKLMASKREGPGFKFPLSHICYGTLDEFLNLHKPWFFNLQNGNVIAIS